MREKGRRRNRTRKKPVLSLAVLSVILFGCVICGWILNRDPSYMDLAHGTEPPGSRFWFGTDTLGRDIFTMIWYGGRISLFVGAFSALFSAGIAVVIGSLSGLAPDWVDRILMRGTEIFLSIPNLLLTVLLQAALGSANVFGISFVIGVTGWTSMAKVIRAEVRHIRYSGYVTASRCMGGGTFHIIRRHLVPNVLPSVLFMAVMNIRNAITAEATLSFLGIGFPPETISWGSMLSLAESALLSGAWWIVVIPGAFLVITLVCVTNIGYSFLEDSV